MFIKNLFRNKTSLNLIFRCSKSLKIKNFCKALVEMFSNLSGNNIKSSLNLILRRAKSLCIKLLLKIVSKGACESVQKWNFTWMIDAEINLIADLKHRKYVLININIMILKELF